MKTKIGFAILVCTSSVMAQNFSTILNPAEVGTFTGTDYRAGVTTTLASFPDIQVSIQAISTDFDTGAGDYPLMQPDGMMEALLLSPLGSGSKSVTYHYVFTSLSGANRIAGITMYSSQGLVDNTNKEILQGTAGGGTFTGVFGAGTMDPNLTYSTGSSVITFDNIANANSPVTDFGAIATGWNISTLDVFYERTGTAISSSRQPHLVSLDIQPVPEPSGVVLAAFSVLSLIGYRRR